jgi:hypothetical protein
MENYGDLLNGWRILGTEKYGFFDCYRCVMCPDCGDCELCEPKLILVVSEKPPKLYSRNKLLVEGEKEILEFFWERNIPVPEFFEKIWRGD